MAEFSSAWRTATRNSLSGSQINNLIEGLGFHCHLCAASSGEVSLAVRWTVCLVGQHVWASWPCCMAEFSSAESFSAIPEDAAKHRAEENLAIDLSHAARTWFPQCRLWRPKLIYQTFICLKRIRMSFLLSYLQLQWVVYLVLYPKHLLAKLKSKNEYRKKYFKLNCNEYLL